MFVNHKEKNYFVGLSSLATKNDGWQKKGIKEKDDNQACISTVSTTVCLFCLGLRLRIGPKVEI